MARFTKEQIAEYVIERQGVEVITRYTSGDPEPYREYRFYFLPDASPADLANPEPDEFVVTTFVPGNEFLGVKYEDTENDDFMFTCEVLKMRANRILEMEV